MSILAILGLNCFTKLQQNTQLFCVNVKSAVQLSCSLVWCKAFTSNYILVLLLLMLLLITTPCLLIIVRPILHSLLLYQPLRTTSSGINCLSWITGRVIERCILDRNEFKMHPCKKNKTKKTNKSCIMYSFRGMNHAIYLFVILIFLLMFHWLQVVSSLCNNG